MEVVCVTPESLAMDLFKKFMWDLNVDPVNNHNCNLISYQGVTLHGQIKYNMAAFMAQLGYCHIGNCKDSFTFVFNTTNSRVDGPKNRFIPATSRSLAQLSRRPTGSQCLTTDLNGLYSVVTSLRS